MKNILLVQLVVIQGMLGLGSVALAENPGADDAGVPAPVAGVFAPEKGFDDNDDIQLVIDGYLPNACYVKSTTQIQTNLQEKKILVVQKIQKIQSDACEDEKTIPDSMKLPSRFMAEVSLGQLPVGEYQVAYQGLKGIATRALSVEKAHTQNVDNAFYAITTNAFVSEVVSASEAEFMVNLTGYLNSPCVSISSKIKGAYLNDVIILLPEIVKSGRVCTPQAQDFVMELKLQTPPPGRYLLHVRSVNGTAVNRLFTVK